MKILRIAVTPGEPAGIGPDLVIQLAQQGHNHEWVVVADPKLLKQRAAQLGLPLNIRLFDPAQAPKALTYGELCVHPVTLEGTCEAGHLNVANGRYVLSTLDTAIELCQSQTVAAMVTGPVQKSVINEAGIAFSGHTEYLADKTNTEKVVMMLATKGLRVALVTTHLPLRDVADAINEDNLLRTVRILQKSLQQQFHIRKPRIVVCGLNPHAGEGGHLGREEIDTIIPALNKLREEGIDLMGPLPADTLFTPKILNDADAALAMYHDQGLPVLKFKGFGRAVNITLGLPIIRTSVDHGTALDLAGSGRADVGSLATALDTAIEMAGGK